MKLRHMAVALLVNQNNDILFLQKGEDHHFLPGYLVPIGGHMEKEEMSDPKRACIREIREEAGLTEDDLSNLKLKYVVHRILEDEIRIQYIFVAQINEGAQLIESDEGKLYWKSLEQIETSKITKPIKYVCKHYFDVGKKADTIVVLSF